ncbi:MAG: heavy metal-associated domain-containing protein, partial [Peptostreptococcaceae bacterium]
MGACSLVKKEILLGGLNCAHCAEVINEKVSKLEEVESSNLNFINKKLIFEVKEDLNIEMVIDKVIDIINSTEPGLDIQINHGKIKESKNTEVKSD